VLLVLLALLAPATLPGCRTPVEPALLDARTLARERREAVMQPGLQVCRRVPVGSTEHDWLRGTVVAMYGERVAVRIDDPGRFPHHLDGTSVAAGARLLSAPGAWTPCF
jgi:hypothetical protein